MSELNIGILKEILANVPDEYIIGFSGETFYHSINKVEIDVDDEMVVLK
ncbi:hypothetical protein [Methanobrevibacter sp.]